MNLRWMLLFALTCSVVGLTSCGTATPQVSPSGLIGNWNLAGDRALGQYPLLSMNLGVIGNQIMAEGDMDYPCPPGNTSVGSSVLLSGSIASNGTFHLTEPMLQGPLPTPITQVTVDGTAPAKGSTTWSGSYTITPVATVNCDGIAHTASFTATAFPPVHATYSGKLAGILSDPAINLNVQITQGSPKTIQSVNGTSFIEFPLDGTISVQGLSCFKQGTTNDIEFQSDVEGDSILMNFDMDDGSQVLLDGSMSDTSEKNVDKVLLLVTGGNCNGYIGSGTLTAQ